MNIPKVGDKLKAKKDASTYSHYGDIQGTVVAVDFWSQHPGILRETNNGVLTITLANVGNLDHCSVGQVVYFPLVDCFQIFEVDNGILR